MGFPRLNAFLFFPSVLGDQLNTGDVGYDAWVLKISVDLEDLGTLTEDDFDWGIQFGTVAYDTPQKIILDSDDNIYVIGTTADNSDVLSESASKRSISEGVSDFMFYLF